MTRFLHRVLSARSAALVVVLAVGGPAAAFTVMPNGHDFGKVPVGGMEPAQFTIDGLVSGEVVTAAVTGGNAGDWTLPGNARCAYDPASNSCVIDVAFAPTSVGRKTSTLTLIDGRGNQTTAALAGEAVDAGNCKMSVVSCNYGHLYSGSFSWNSVLAGERSRSTLAVTVTVVQGVATCDGSATDVDVASGSKAGSIKGPGLFAVEFSRNRGGWVYNITAACPSVDNPEMGGASRPAELGHNEQQSYEQPAAAVGINLVGTNSYQDGAADPVNGVDGTVTVSWALRRW